MPGSGSDSNHDYSTFSLGDFKLQSGDFLPNAWIAYKTYGDPSLPAVLYPTWYTGLISDNEWLIGEDKTLSPKHYHIIIPALFGNSQSLSPSNLPLNSPLHPSTFPPITFLDNVRAQHALLTTHLHLRHLRLVLGWSMGAAQSFQWAVQYPDFMDAVVPFCGSARTSAHNRVMLEGVRSTLLSAKGVNSKGVAVAGAVDSKGDEIQSVKREWSEAERVVGLKAFGRVYAGWGFSQTFYRQTLHSTIYGAKDLEDFMKTFWEDWALSKDPENLLVMLYTWQTGDVSLQEPFNGDFEAAMRSIKAKMMVMPSRTDLYFPPEDSEYEVQCMRPDVGRLEVFESVYGHWAGGPPTYMGDAEWLDRKLGEFLAPVK